MAITTRFTSGYQTGDPNAIARRYSKGAALASSFDSIRQSQSHGFGGTSELQMPALPLGNAMGAAGPTGDDPASAPAPAGDNQTMRNAAAFQDSPDGTPPPAGNATQRWQSGGMSISPQRRSFWATGLIDARATQAPQNARTNFDTTFGPDRTHMGSAGTTWADRQANNNAGVAAAVAQRGLPDSWSPY